jgi:nucleotide-binding universal stress UspA family protein
MRLAKILVPTDFSETADHATDQAVELAAKNRCRLELFHVVEPYGEPPPNMMAVVRDYIEKAERDAEQTLAAKAEAVRSAGLDVRYSTSHHVAPFEAIADKIDGMEPDLVVIGTHGRRGFERFMLGSVAEKILRAASVDVLTLSLKAPVVKRDRGFTRILVPVDFSEFSQRALETAFSLLAPDGSLRVVHVVDSPIYPAFYPGPAALPVQVDPELPAKIREHLDQWLKGRKAELTIRDGDAFHEILELGGEIDADLIVMGTRGLRGLAHALLGSVTEKVVRRATIPVLTVH